MDPVRCNSLPHLARWYLINTQPQREQLALENLRRQGYEVYLPRVAQFVRYRGRSRERVGPLFPRYLFLRLQEGRQSLGPIRSSVGVSAVVRFGARYAIVADHIIRELRERADPQTGLHRLAERPLPVRGTPVRITTGAFEGLDGVFERGAGPERVVVLLKMLGQDVSVRVPALFVQAAVAA